MPERICPACHANDTEAVDSVDRKDLIRSYRQKGIDVSAYLHGDSVTLCHCNHCKLGFFDPACVGDGRFYEQLQTQDWYYQDDKPEYAHAAKLIHRDSSVLEVGCGKGAFRRWLPQSIRYTGLEFNDEAVQKARAAGLDVMKQPVEEHAAASPRYDVVCAFQVLEHVEHPKQFFHACVQALKPGGTLLIAVPAQDSFLAIAPNSPLNMPPHHVTRWTDRALTNLARSEGFSTTDIWHEPVADFHKEWHATTLAYHALTRFGLYRPRLIDNGMRYRLLGHLVRRPMLRRYLMRSALRASPRLTVGHTVMLAAS
ncbi:class I SAM-dependent methyltransferase [Massilia sp. CFBP9026]|uniref:class I SAM-dependent methyltransferase n=1 Tax=Massilia sp. CFBP9026 TaxID=3096536 RepID=UPI002A6A29FD|nr:class I SAM-dependent methyltransferase [Massilia sp. CFBP9026]MDY0965306.1 class I SAM-dependent methyltransferase [Massilia sp. CFBP9026]